LQLSCWRKEHGVKHFCVLSRNRRWYQQWVGSAKPSPWGGGLSQVRLLRECERRRVRLKLRDASWRESSSNRCVKLALSQAGQTHAVVGCGATSQIRSPSCEAESKSP
jgi:hypothetical protein